MYDPQSIAKDQKRGNNRSDCSPSVEKPGLVSHNREDADRASSKNFTKKKSAESTNKPAGNSQNVQNPESTLLSSLRERYSHSGISTESSDLITSSWRKGTVKGYDNYIEKWERYAHLHNVDPISPPLGSAVNFLGELFTQNYSYSAICTARSAVSNYVVINNCPCFGDHPLVKRLIKGVYEQRPALPKYSDTWEVDQVLNHFKNQADDLDLKELSFKLVLLLAILTGQRCQTLHLLNIEDMKLSDNKCIFYVNSLLKQSKPGKHIAPIELIAFPDNKKLCVVDTIKAYLHKTENLRNGEKQLFISFAKPYKAISKDSLSRWIKHSLQEAGIDTGKYKAHSTRAASTSAAAQRGVPTDTILKAAGWSRMSTFSKFYKKGTENLGQGLLDAYLKN